MSDPDSALERLPEGIARVFHGFPASVKEEVSAYERDPTLRAKVEAVVGSAFPTPMAMLFRIFRDDAWGKVRDPMTTCKVMLDFLWLLTEYFSYLSLVSYCDHSEVHNDKVESLLRDLRDNSKLSFGHWWGILRDTTRCFSGDNREKHLMPEIVDFYFRTGGGKTQSYIDVFEKIPTFRNRALGHTLGGPAQSRNFVRCFRSYFYFLLDKWRFLADYTLLTPLVADDEDDEYPGCSTPQILLFRGERPRAIDAVSRQPLELCHFYLFRNGAAMPDEWAYGSGRILEAEELRQLSPFLLYDPDDELQVQNELYVQFQHSLQDRKTRELVGMAFEMADRHLDAGLERVVRNGEAGEELGSLFQLLRRFFSASLTEGEPGIVAHPEAPAAPSVVDGGRLDWENLLAACHLTSDRHLRNIVRRTAVVAGEEEEDQPDLKYDSELYVNRRSVEDAFKKFLASPKHGFVLVGASGMGKTCVLCHLYESLSADGHLMLFLNSSNLSADLNIEEEILGRLASRAEFDATLQLIDEACAERGVKLVVLVDAINEFRTDAASPLDLAKRVDDLIAANRHPNVKFVMTSRVKVWQTIMSNYDFRISEPAYFMERPGQVYTLAAFSDDEIRKAYEKYRARYELATPYDQLSERVKTTIADPLMLRFISEVYAGGDVPRTVQTRAVFDEYFNRKVYDTRHDRGDVARKKLVLDIAEAMLELAKDALTQDDLAMRCSRFAHESEAATREGNPARGEELRWLSDWWGALAASLADTKIDSTYVRLLDEGILTEQQHAGKHRIKFTYDRFFEYVLTNILLRQMEKALTPSLRQRQQRQELVRFVREMVPGAMTFNTLWGALEGVLLAFHDGQLNRFTKQETVEPVSLQEFNRFLAELTESEDVTVLALVASALEKMALKDISTFDRTVEELWNDDMDPGESSEEALRQRAVSKMLLETAYKILTSDAHRALYTDLDEAGRAIHLSVLDKVFRRGMQSSPGTTSDTATQYIYYLWKYRIEDEGSSWLYFKEHAETILAEIADEAAQNLGRVYTLIVKKHRNSLFSLVVLFVLILAENCDRPDRIATVMESIRVLLKRVHGSLMFKALVHIADRIGGGIWNTFSVGAVKAILQQGEARSAALDLLEYLDPLARPMGEPQEADRILELSHDPNGIVRQLLAHGLSSQYSIHPDQQGTLLEVIDRMFAIDSPVPRFDASVALYHINYFGKYQSEATLERFGKQVELIQREYKGRFTVPDLEQPVNFNIVGEYARALVSWGQHLAENPERREEASEFRAGFADRMRFVVSGLEAAKRDHDLEYYLGLVVDDIALLGVLVPPRNALEMIKYVLQDAEVIELPDDGREELPFDDDQFGQVRHAALESLAKIRMRYQREVEEFLYSVDKPELIDEVRKLAPEFSFKITFSWLFEELFEKILIYYPDLGSRVIHVIKGSVSQTTVDGLFKHMLSGILAIGQDWVGGAEQGEAADDSDASGGSLTE